jgi:hypothetical protein
VDAVDARRLARSHLDERAPLGQVLDVTRAILGLHAQLPTTPTLSLAARVDGITRAVVDDLLWERRALVKGNTIRGTLHLQTPADFALWKSAYEPRWRTEQWLRWQELSLRDAEHLREGVLAVLDEPRTRAEIGAAVGGAFGTRIAADSWGHLLAPANDAVCHGPPRGRNVTFVRADAWLPGFRHVDRVDALQQLVDRFVHTYGPVERAELEHWLAAPLPPEVDLPDAGPFPAATPRGVRLLPHYDVYVIACHPRDRLIPEHRERIFHRGAGPQPALLVDGRVRGTWSRATGIEPWIRLTTAQQREADAELVRLRAALR